MPTYTHTHKHCDDVTTVASRLGASLHTGMNQEHEYAQLNKKQLWTPKKKALKPPANSCIKANGGQRLMRLFVVRALYAAVQPSPNPLAGPL